MSKVAILSDTTMTIPQEFAQQYDIYTIPLYVVFNEQPYKDVEEITYEQFFERLKAGEMATTSQAAPGEFVEKYEFLKSQGYDEIIVTVISAKMSGTYQAAIAAIDFVEGITVHVVDTELTTIFGGLAVMEMAKLLNNGAGSSEAIQVFTKIVRERAVDARITVDSLTHLQRGGRLSRVSATVGELLQIKPILTISDGEMKVLTKMRTFKKAVMTIAEEAAQTNPTVMYIFHTGDEKLIAQLRQAVEQLMPDVPCEQCYLSPTVGAHIGPTGIGLAWLSDYKK
ncbi:MAG: DegV family protein [Culicoidibacterales bacterium]